MDAQPASEIKCCATSIRRKTRNDGSCMTNVKRHLTWPLRSPFVTTHTMLRTAVQIRQVQVLMHAL